jgi:hypothetical protein
MGVESKINSTSFFCDSEIANPCCMHDVATIAEVMRSYPVCCRPCSVPVLISGQGFSGARIWKVGTAAGPVCLRQWPREHPSRERLERIHGVLLHVAETGLRYVPRPIRTTSGTSFVSHAGHFWEVTTWLRGRADFHQNPSSRRLAAALDALARFHLAAANCPATWMKPGACPAIGERWRECERLHRGGLDESRQRQDQGAHQP